MSKKSAKQLKKLTAQFRALTPSRQTALLFIVGLSLVAFFGFYQNQKQARLSFNGTPPITPYKIEHAGSLPAEIEITRLNIKLPIRQTQITSGVWQIPADGAAHLIHSALPGEKGSIIIYGHNSVSVLGPLGKAQVDDIVNVKTRSGQLHSYRIIDISAVGPKNIEILKSHGEEILVLYTCTGFADSKRLVVKARPL